MKLFKRIGAGVLAAVLVLGLLATAAFADEAEPGLKLDQTKIYIAVGESLQLNATVTPEQPVQWSSLTTSVVGVDETGLVTGLSEGRATVKAVSEDGTMSANCTVYVYMAFPSFSMREGETLQLSATLTDGVVWTSQNAAIATVSPTGEVTAQAFGRTYITATDAAGTVESFSITVGGHVGIDISSWNNEIDWEKVKAQGIEFAMIRAGYGWEHTDKRFIENIEGAIAHDMPIGIYFYSYAKTVEKAKVEAEYCAKLLAPYRDQIVLPVAYDLEEYKEMSGAELTAVAEVFCTILQDAGFHTMVYANSQFLPNMDLQKLSGMGVDYWYAWYQTVPELHKPRHIVKTDVVPNMWQYSDSCVVEGALASGRTDINVMYMPEYLDITAPKLTIEATVHGANLRWGGSTYAGSYTVHRKEANGQDREIAKLTGTLHHFEDAEFQAGQGYYVTMEIADPLGGDYRKTYTSETIYPHVVTYDVKAAATEGGTATGGGAVPAGGEITLTAAALEGYQFDGWFDENGVKLTEELVYTFEVHQTQKLEARFSKLEVPVEPEVPTEPEPPVEPEQPELTITFTDVPADAWFAEAVQYVVENGLFSGVSETEFAPRMTMSRSMMATVLYRQAGSPEASNRNRFNDVSKDAWYARAVTWASANKIMNGTAEKLFSPDLALTREQLATILMRYTAAMGLEVPETTAGDLSLYADHGDISSFALEGMQWAVSTQLLSGTNDQKLLPKQAASRAECAVILMRWMESLTAAE